MSTEDAGPCWAPLLAVRGGVPLRQHTRGEQPGPEPCCLWSTPGTAPSIGSRCPQNSTTSREEG